jgi:hypothetical protein
MRFYQPEMKLECSASGIPKPTLEWSLEGTRPDFIPFESEMSTYAHYYLPTDKNYEIAKEDLEIGMSLFRTGGDG